MKQDEYNEEKDINNNENLNLENNKKEEVQGEEKKSENLETKKEEDKKLSEEIERKIKEETEKETEQENLKKEEEEERKKNEEERRRNQEAEEAIRRKKEEFKEKLQESLNKNKKTSENDFKRKFKTLGGKFNFKGFILLIFIITLIMSLPTILGETKKTVKNTSYSEFISEMKLGNFKIVKEKEGHIYGYKTEEDLKNNNNYTSARMLADRLANDKMLLETISTSPVKIMSESPDEIPFLLSLLASWAPILLIIGLWVFMLGRVNKGGGGGPQIFSMGKAKTKDEGEVITNVSFADVAGIDEAKNELEEIVEFLREPEKFKKIGAKIPKGVLLLGGPGTGKTLLAKAVAGEAKVPFFSMSGSEFVEMFVGVGASRVRDLFTKARKNTPCIIFIDEIDAVGRKRGSGQGGGNDEREQTLNQLLVEMDGFGTDETIIVLAATNRPDVLDKALIRPGRFDRQVTVDKPDLKGRQQILEVHAKNKKIASDVDWKIIAKKTAGLVGADLANMLNEAAIIAARATRDEITMSDLEEASEKIAMGPEKRSKVVSAEDKKITAFHEAGHAVVNHLIGGEDKVHKITIIPRGFAGGYTMSLPVEEKQYQSRKHFMDELLMLFGGRAAEEIVFGYENITSGASSDIQRATSIAQYMVTRVGMTKKFGPILLDGTQDGDMFQRKYYSEQTGKEVDDEIRKILNEAYEETVKILTENRVKLDEVTAVLLEKETIMGEEFEAIMNS